MGLPRNTWRSFLIYMLFSTIVASIGFAASWGGIFSPLSFWLAAVWLVLLVVGLFRYRWKGLILLTGAPLALMWPAAGFAIASACAENIAKCP